MVSFLFIFSKKDFISRGVILTPRKTCILALYWSLRLIFCIQSKISAAIEPDSARASNVGSSVAFLSVELDGEKKDVDRAFPAAAWMSIFPDCLPERLADLGTGDQSGRENRDRDTELTFRLCQTSLLSDDAVALHLSELQMTCPTSRFQEY